MCGLVVSGEAHGRIVHVGDDLNEVAVRLLMTQSENSNRFVRATATDSLGVCGGTGQATRALNDPDANVRGAGVTALVRMRAVKQKAAAMKHALHKESHATVMFALARALHEASLLQPTDLTSPIASPELGIRVHRAFLGKVTHMLACVDVHYSHRESIAGCIVFDGWTDAHPIEEVVHTGPAPADYKPGEFYLRELPSVIAVMEKLSSTPSTILVDGYVWLGPSKNGMGAYVHEAIGVPVIGVAKRPFRGAMPVEVYRGASRRPLFVTSVGIPPLTAAQHVESMRGPYRLPTILKRADRLCRDGMSGSARPC